MVTDAQKAKRKGRWYFGGIASAAGATCTHPLDLIKVNLQTQQGNLSIFGLIKKIASEQGILAFYSGLSASVLRQMTYSLARFGIYETGKNYINTDTFGGKVKLATFAGTIGGIVGTPGDVVNVRMQNDVKLPKDQRRNYKHAFDGIIRIYSQEGFKRLFSGATMATGRGVLMTIGQIAFYDQTKVILLASPYFEDNFTTHFTSSLVAGTIATIMTQPMDVLKTRTMNAKPGEFKGIFDLVKFTARLGPMGFFKGFIPSFVRLGPQTIILFMIYEQLRIHCGIDPAPEK